MNAHENPWRQPGVIALIALVVLINLVVDWLVFKPTSLVAFLLVEAVIVGAILWWALERRPRS